MTSDYKWVDRTLYTGAEQEPRNWVLEGPKLFGLSIFRSAGWPTWGVSCDLVHRAGLDSDLGETSTEAAMAAAVQRAHEAAALLELELATILDKKIPVKG